MASSGAPIAAAWAVRLAQQPRPVPDDAVDRAVTLTLLGGVALAAGLRSVASIDTLAVRRRVRRFATSLSNASDMESIAAHLRHATRDPTIEIARGDRTSEGTSAATSLRRGQHVVDRSQAVQFGAIAAGDVGAFDKVGEPAVVFRIFTPSSPSSFTNAKVSVRSISVGLA